MKALRCVVACFLNLALFITAHIQAADFILLRDVLPNPAPGMDSRPHVADVSSDGSTVIGSYSSTIEDRLFQWRRGIGVNIIRDSLGQPIAGSVIAVSADGRIVLGRDNANAGRTFLWSETSGVHYINDLPVQQDLFALPRDLSGDGSTIVGNIVDFTMGSFNDAGGFVWNATNGLSILPKLPVANSGALYAVAISDDGSTVVGGQSASAGSDVTPIHWTQGTGTTSLGKINGLPSGAIGASADGSVILGDRVPGGQRFLWSEATNWQLSSGLPGLTSDYGYNELAAEGAVIVGWQVIIGSPNDVVEPIIWDQTFGARSLRTLFETATGVPLNNNNLGQAEEVSANGTVIGGNGHDSTDGWIIVFSPSELVPEPPSFLLTAIFFAVVVLRRRPLGGHYGRA